MEELSRVVKPGGFVFISVMSRWGVFNYYGIRSTDELMEDGYYEVLAGTGEDHNWRREGYYAHYYTTDEVQKLLDDSPLRLEKFLSLQGLTTGSIEVFNTLDRESPEFSRWMKFLQDNCEDRIMSDMGFHFMVLCRKPE